MAEYALKKYRRLERSIIRIRVLDAESGSFFAYTGNLHKEGMMLTSEKKILLGKEYHLELVHLHDNGKRITIPLRVRCVWDSSIDDLNWYTSGFEIIDLEPQYARDIEILIEELAVD